MGSYHKALVPQVTKANQKDMLKMTANDSVNLLGKY